MLDIPNLDCVSTHSCKCSTCDQIIDAPPTFAEEDAMRHMVQKFERHVEQEHSQMNEIPSQTKSSPRRDTRRQ